MTQQGCVIGNFLRVGQLSIVSFSQRGQGVLSRLAGLCGRLALSWS